MLATVLAYHPGGSPHARPAGWTVALWLAAVSFIACDSRTKTAVRDQQPPQAIAVKDTEWPAGAVPAVEGAAVAPQEIDELLALQAQREGARVAEASYWQEGPVLRWNEIARGLVAQYATNPVVASRVYALLSVAQHDALIAAMALHQRSKRPPPSSVDSRIVPLFAARVDSTYPSDHAVLAGASAAVLAGLYPSKEEREALDAKARAHQESRLFAGISFRSDIVAGDRLGREVARRVLERAVDDGSRRIVPWPGKVPVGKGLWYSSETPPVEPIRPGWGQVRPWLMRLGDQFRPEPPPDVDSSEFEAALDEVRGYSRKRTPEQLRIALFWADGPGTATPAGHWNQIAADLIRAHSMSQLGAARVMAYLNIVLMDAGISSWDAKYHYWLLRPSHADPTISLPIGLPNFPSYTSGHSTFSGAAAEILGHFFPEEKERLAAMAQEASISRLYGGIHYRFDAEKGVAQGRQVAGLGIEKEKAERGEFRR